MIKKPIWALTVLVLTLSAPPTYGEIPLAQVFWGTGQSTGASGPLPTSLPFSFSMGGTGGGGSWSRETVAADFGQTFRPDAMNLSRMISSWHSSDLGAFFQAGLLSDFKEVFDLDGMLNSGVMVPGVFAESFVPTPTAYDLSDVTIQVSQWQVGYTDGGAVFYSAGMTVRFYAVPECSTLALASLVLCVIVGHRSRR
jgi:hypothetical protein